MIKRNEQVCPLSEQSNSHRNFFFFFFNRNNIDINSLKRTFLYRALAYDFSHTKQQKLCYHG